MNKSELITEVAYKTKLTKVVISKVLDAITETVTEEVSNGSDVTLIGFGTFKRNERAARKGRNPRTGAELDIPASKVPAFKAGKTFKEAVNV